MEARTVGWSIAALVIGTFGIVAMSAVEKATASRDLARFMLEGMARAQVTYDKDERVERLLTVIKRATHMLNRKGGVTDLWPE